MYVQLVTPQGRRLRGLGRLREYRDGTYSVPGWNYNAPAAPVAAPCCCGAGRKRPGLRGLGDDSPIVLPAPDSGALPFDPVTGMPTGVGLPQVSIYSVAPGVGGNMTSAQLATLATTPTAQLVPAVSASTLLEAASLPGAPSVVKQAAAAYAANNPVGSFFSGPSGVRGIPNYLLLAGAIGVVGLAMLITGREPKRK